MKDLLHSQDFQSLDLRSVMLTGNFNPSPENAWAVAKPIVIYGDYLFRRIAIQQNLSTAIDVILNGTYKSKLFGESPNRFVRLAMCMPFAVVAAESLRAKTNTAVEMRLKEVGEYVMNGGIGIPQDSPANEANDSWVSAGDIGETAFMFGMTPFIYRTLPGLSESDIHRATYEENKEFHTGLDFSNKLGFKVMVYRWRKLAKREFYI
jgi:hypothetical protein